MVNSGGNFGEHVIEIGIVALMEETSFRDDLGWGGGGRVVCPVEWERVGGGNNGMEVIIALKFNQPRYFDRRDLLCGVVSDVDEFSIVEDEVFKEADALVRKTIFRVVTSVGGTEIAPIIRGGEG